MIPKISIIVPVYNVEDYLPQCLDSLLSQTMEDIEIICVNDGSTDSSLSLLESYAKKDSRIVVINKENAGVSYARNAGLEKVRGDFYMFVDSDDWLEPETCDVAYAYILSYRADCLMFSYVKEFGGHSITNHIFERDFIWEKEEVINRFHRRLFGLVGSELLRPQDGDIIVSPCMQLFRTSKYKEIKFYDIREIGTFEDGLYQMDIYNECNRLVYIDKPYYHYRRTNNDSITTRYNPNLISQWQNLFRVIQKKMPQGQEYYLEAFNNRICLSIIGIGLNEVRSKRGYLTNASTIRNLLKTKNYTKAYSVLQLKYFPIQWKMFFFFAKKRLALPLINLLYIMEYLRKHKK